VNVCREDDLGDHPGGWLHDVYFTLLLFFVSDHSLGKDLLLPEAIQSPEGGVHEQGEKGIKRR